MRNLKLLYNKTSKIANESLIHIVLNSNESGVAYVSTANTLFQYNLENNVTQTLYTTAEEIIGVEYLSLNDEICIATSDGDVIVLNLRSNHTENVSYCNGGIEQMTWSPDQEIVAFVTKSKQLVVMNSMYDPIYEGALDEQSFGVNEFITVGWGKKETQFHGTEGKEAAKKTTDVGVTLDVEQIDKTIKIVWRGDCEYFAVSFVGENGRMFKVFDKEGSLQFTSEKCSGLEAPIYWRPSGSWIAVPQILPNKYAVALFEKNGLRHREIILPFKANEEPIITLCWSGDSEVLAIETFNHTTQKSHLYLYTICNYHWYPKQCLQFESRIVSFTWDTKFTEGKSLHVLLANGTYSIYRWEFTVDCSTGRHANEPAVVCVVDGCNILLTDFRHSVVPPPMCTETIVAMNPINCVGFLQFVSTDNHQSIFTIDSAGIFAAYRLEIDVGKLKISRLYESDTIINNIVPMYLHHWLWLTDGVLLATNASHEKNAKNTNILLFELNEGKLSACHSLMIPATVVNIVASSHQCVIVQTTSGSIYELKIHDNRFENPVELFQLPDFCEKMLVHQNDTALDVYSLKTRQSLFWNDQKIAADVTSIFMTEKYLAFTTLDQLKFVRLSDHQIINERRMERGGKLVIIVAKESRTILQMPRGNLEAIQPRVLSLCIIGELLQASEYRKAFDLLRKQRINLNLLADHNPSKFLSEIDLFVDLVDNSNWLNLFLSDLQNANVTETMYSSNYAIESAPTDQSFFANKIQRICDRICDVLIARKSTKFVLPIITAYVKQNQLETAMLMVSDLRQNKLNSFDVADDKQIDAHGALTYLLYLVDVNQLYNVALGMYDFDLVLFVATKSQKDPKEYLPFLNELKQLDESYRKFKIDCYLKRYHKALRHIVICGDERFDECLKLVTDENLFAEAMRLYEGQTECYRKITLAYAEYLRTNGKVRDACLMYERGGDLQQALLSAKHIMDWEKCLTLARQMNWQKEDVDQLVVSLIPALKESGNYIDAADLAINRLNDVPLAVKIFCDGKMYPKALFLARMNEEHMTLIDTDIKPHLTTYVKQLIETIQEEELNKFLKFKSRLKSIRMEKSKQKLQNDCDDVDDSDMFSDTSSMNSSRFSNSSRGTGKTHRSSKNRRKHERKLLSLKEGNPYEDIALIDALHSLTLSSFEQQKSIRVICRTLVDQRMDQQGIELQKVFGKLLATVKSSLDEIWIPEMITSGQMASDGTVDYALLQDDQHYSMINLHQRFKPQIKLIDWELDILK